MKVQKVSFSKLKKLNKNGIVEKNYSLKNLNTFRIGGKCDYYLEINTLECFLKTLDYLNNINAKIFVLGNGSNILISDKDFHSVVIKLLGDFARIESKDEFLEVGGGVLLPKLYTYTLEHELSGFEEGGLIPATIGGAVYMNAQTGNYLTSNIVEYVIAYHKGKIHYLENKDCDFAHKKSIFQNGEYIILRVGLRLKKSIKQDIEKKHHEAYVYRKNNHPIEFPSAGCVYKKADDRNISKMLEDLGIKGKSIGGAYVSTKHANFILSNNAKAKDVYELMKEIEKEFFNKYRFNLEKEIILVGEFDED